MIVWGLKKFLFRSPIIISFLLDPVAFSTLKLKESKNWTSQGFGLKNTPIWLIWLFIRISNQIHSSQNISRSSLLLWIRPTDRYTIIPPPWLVRSFLQGRSYWLPKKRFLFKIVLSKCVSVRNVESKSWKIPKTCSNLLGRLLILQWIIKF